MQITITPGAMRALEKDYMTLRGVPGALLMEHAAQAVCDALARRIPGGPCSSADPATTAGTAMPRPGCGAPGEGRRWCGSCPPLRAATRP